MQKKLTILQINDTHSYLELHNELFYERDKLAFRKAGGYARLQSLIKDFRSKNPTLVFDNGDTILAEMMTRIPSIVGFVRMPFVAHQRNNGITIMR